MEHQPKGIHYLIDLFECNAEKLNDLAFIRKTIIEAATLANTTILNEYFHEFQPQGITGSLVIAESHINIHTWPEHGYAAIDVFTCGDQKFPNVASNFLSERLASKRHTIVENKRGFIAQ